MNSIVKVILKTSGKVLGTVAAAVGTGFVIHKGVEAVSRDKAMKAAVQANNNRRGGF